ncbi:MAG TPA: sulfurtransferase [Acidimicrobiaceae bacterium]|nr:sulfurtransferase [Actinomycetota bacterium]MDG1197434.1 rhodanese-like domain-containing protein [Actinomycetota bacterium]MDG2119913.1 rhodanese-like domain-containing protein [Actinomycetota bacterium]NCG39393.1 rhodanese-like domain-containing protein [Actinomycetota bacterium]HAN07753.1 sulfurtransferase [Acidimicrobiaceae bacterium]
MNVPEISVNDLAKKLLNGAFLIDVRELDEWITERVPEVPLIPLGEITDRLAEFPKEREVFVICRSGARSATACQFLRSNDVNAINVAGGTLAWIASGEAVASGPS